MFVLLKISTAAFVWATLKRFLPVDWRRFSLLLSWFLESFGTEAAKHYSAGTTERHCARPRSPRLRRHEPDLRHQCLPDWHSLRSYQTRWIADHQFPAFCPAPPSSEAVSASAALDFRKLNYTYSYLRE